MGKTYIGQIIDEVNAVTAQCGPVLLFGENIDTGSRIAGLARGLTVNPAGRILNVGNCELTHIGLGMGMMLDGGRAVVFMKQLDFLLLGLDHLVNTLNSIRAFRDVATLGSFTIFVIVCDQGYQGPQSSLNNASDIASLANVNVYCLNGAHDAAHVLRDHFVAPGFRIVCVSQRVFGAPALDAPIQCRADDNSLFQYRSGNDVTLVCYNFSLRDGVALADTLAAAGVHADLFHANYVPGMNHDLLVESCARTGRLVVVDDSKSVAKFADSLFATLHSRGVDISALTFGRRGCRSADYGVTEDRFVPDYGAVLQFVQRDSVV